MRKESLLILIVVATLTLNFKISAQDSGQGFSINSSQLVSSLIIEAGENVTLVSPVVGSSYQWKLNGEEVKGANSKSYNIKESKTGDEGTYTLDVNGKNINRALTLNVENSLINIIKEDIWQVSCHNKYYGPVNERKIDNPVTMSFNGSILQIKNEGKKETKS